MSSLWNHFIRLASGFAKCKYCPMQYNMKKTTASLRYHIRNKHPEKCKTVTPIELPDPESRSDDEPVPGTHENSNKRRKISTKEYYSRNNPKSEAITASLVQMIAVDMLPLSFGEGPGLLQFLRTVCPDYTIPSKTVIKNRLQGLYGAVRNKLLSSINRFPYVSITTDGWSSRGATSFITVTAHAIDEQWNLRSFTLDTLEMSEDHTAKNMYDHLVKSLEEWNLYEKVIAVVHDNAPNIVAAIRDNWKVDNDIEKSVRCVCHSLQCVVERALKEDTLNKYLHKVSAIVGHFKHSNKATTALTCAQKKHHLPSHRLISCCVTRWNSTYAMIERAIEQRKAIECVLLNKEITSADMAKKLLLENREWDYLQAVKKILKPFDVATRVMSTESQSTISMVRPMVYSLSKKFLQPEDDDSAKIHLLKDILEEELSTRFLNDTKVTVCGLACYLDPRYKDLPDETESYRDAVKKKLTEMITKENTFNEPQSSSKNQTENDLEYLFDLERALSRNLERMASFEDITAIEKEMKEFEREPTVPRGDNPLIWWNTKRHKFPILASYAKIFLCVPSSSTPSERVFSTAGNIITAKRNCLLPENANLLIFLYQNRHIIERIN